MISSPDPARVLVRPDRTACEVDLKVLPRETTYVKETPGVDLFWEQMSIDPDHTDKQCRLGQHRHFEVCYDKMITPEVRSIVYCLLEPRHPGPHAAEIGICESDTSKDMWLFWEVGVPGARKIEQPGYCPWEMDEVSTLCVLAKDHVGLHRAQGLGYVDDACLNRYGERPTRKD